VKSFDLIVIGGGSGGLATAQRAAEYGARVAVFEPGPLGGTCVNVGCVPKKVMWYASEIAIAMQEAGGYGFDVVQRGHDFARLKSARDAYVRRLNGIYARNLDRRSITLVASRARLTSAREVLAQDGQRYAAEHIVIATGGRPRIPDIPGADSGITSDGFFELTELPGRTAVVGSGYVAVELAVLRSFDAMLSERLIEEMRHAGIRIVTDAVPHSVNDARRIALHTADGQSHEQFDVLIWAIGRSPRTVSLGLDDAGVAVDAGGYVVVDEYQNTSVPRIYAVGDVTGQAELTPVAIAAGRRLADRVFDAQTDRRLSYENIPTVIFSHPPVGTVGLSETQARARFGDNAVKVYRSEFVPMFNALGVRKPKTAMKLVTVGEDERLTGCHIVGLGADEILQGFAVALVMGARKRDLDDTVAIHPTSAEELVTMR
jgi:glutathione reductase (NADPH)